MSARSGSGGIWGLGLWLVFAAAVCAQAVWAQEGEVLRLEASRLEAAPVELDTGWQMLTAGPALPRPDADWKPISTTARGPRQTFENWRGIAWFRLPIEVAPDLVGQVLALRLEHAGASEVFVGQNRLARFGTADERLALEVPWDPHGQPVHMVFDRPGRHELLLRYSCALAARPKLADWFMVRRGAGFRAVLDLPDRAIEEIIDGRTAYLALNLGFSALASGFAILHGLIFFFHRRHRGNLWFAVFAASLAMNGGLESLLRWGHLGLIGMTLTRFFNLLAALGIVLGLILFLDSLRRQRKQPRRMVSGLAVSFLAVCLTSHVPALLEFRPWVVSAWFLGAVGVVIVTAWKVWRERTSGLEALGVSAAGVVGFLLAEIAKQMGFLATFQEVLAFGLNGLLILSGASLFLARRIALEGRELESLARDLEDRVSERTAALRESERAALAASEAKSTFLATMSHEIRTPMNAVVGLSELLVESNLPEDKKQMARTLQRSAVSLLGLIDEVLDFSRIESGRLTIEQKPFAVREVLREVVDLFMAQAQRRGLEFRCEIAEDIPLAQLGDPARLRQVLVNLVGNAIKFTHEGEVLLRADAEGEEIAFTVQDTGSGIPADVIDRLFEPFYQVDGSVTRQHGGAGLGLAISQRLVEAMEGRFEVESDVGQGSSFRVRLPMCPVLEAETSDFRPETVDGEHLSGSFSILLVEDHPVNQRVVEQMFAHLGYEIDLAENGQQALQVLRQKSYDIVFLDLHMPVMGGIEAAERIRAEHPSSSPRLVALTASVLAEDRERCRAAGMDDFLAKPIQLKALRAALARAGRQPRP